MTRINLTLDYNFDRNKIKKAGFTKVVVAIVAVLVIVAVVVVVVAVVVTAIAMNMNLLMDNKYRRRVYVWLYILWEIDKAHRR